MNDIPAPEKAKFRAMLSPDLMQRCMMICYQEQTRFYIQGVKVMPHADGGALMVATDGRRLIAMRDTNAIVEGEAIVKLSTRMMRACRASRRSPSKLIIDGQRAGLTEFRDLPKGDDPNLPLMMSQCLERLELLIGIEEFQWDGLIIDGEFPDWRRVIPTAVVAKAERKNIQLDARLLHELAFALTGKNQQPLVKLIGSTKGAPIIVLPDVKVSGVECVGIIMPAWHHREPGSLKMPDWFMPPKKPAAVPSAEMAEMIQRIASTEGGARHA